MRIEVRRLGGADVVLVSGALDLRTTASLRAVLDGRLGAGRVELVVDLSGVRLLDAGAIGLLASVADRAERVGGCLRAVGARGICLDALSITGLDKRLHAYDEPSDLSTRYAAAEPVDQFDQLDQVERWPGSRDITVSCLLAAVATLPARAPERADLRAQVIEDNMPFARRMARRFRDRGEPTEDLVQVAMVGLVNAVDGFDPGRGCEFVGYAAPTVGGEIRRYFRDKTWRIHVPRRLQELRGDVSQARVELTQRRGSSPTVPEIARYLGIGDTDVVEAMEVARMYSPVSLSAAVSGADAATADGAGFASGDDDPAIEAVDNRESVRLLLAVLPDRERRILVMRFFRDMSQLQIANELGMSQMHVSRLLSKTLSQLRTTLVDA